MLKISHVNAAIAVANKLDNMGYRLLPVVNTPLASLNSDLNTVFNTTDGEFIPSPESYVASANILTEGQDYSVYTANMDHTARSIAVYVQSHLSFAKNVVKPLITELVECFTEKVNAINISPATDFVIEKLNLPAPMLVSDIKDAIDDYADIQAQIPNYVKFDAPELSIVEIVDLLKTGNKAVDESIDQWVAMKGEGFFTQVYEGLFTQKQTNLRQNGGWISTMDNSWDSTLCAFLMTRNLHDKPWKDCNMSLVDYNVAIANLRDAAGYALTGIYSIMANCIKTNTLIRSAFGSKMVVVKPVYDMWVQDGGNDVLLFGVLISGKRLNFINEINEAKIDLLKSWELHSAMSISTERNRKFTMMKKTLYGCVFDLVESNAEGVFTHLKKEGFAVDHIEMQEYKTFKQKFEDYYAYVSDKDFADVWCMAKTIVCDQIFYYTDSGAILDGIEDATKNNPEISVDEAALLSTISYVTKYVCNQMVLSKI
jgi:hypothetical protein